ncbi:response regulator [Desulfococcaceae bacterium HSG7]|nr:response regulator [Desulfococcaceae bacterium HSG7]
MPKVKILVVEDEMIIVRKIKIILTDMGYEVTSIADTGKDAIQKAVETQPDLVMMDIVLKGDMDGIQAAVHIREQTDIPIIYLTGYGDDQTLKRAKATEPVGYILKPFSEDQMRVTIQSGMELHRSRQKLDAAQREYSSKLEKQVKQRTSDLRMANTELEQANRLKDEFLANMSHELRTPLTAVMGVSEALIEQVYGPLNAKQLQSLQLIAKSGKHLLNLITDILDLSAINAGKMELKIDQVSIDDVCQKSMHKIKEMAEKKEHKLFMSINSELKHIRADTLRVKQILVNLLTNAVKFTPQGGKIGLEVNHEPNTNKVEFIVWDNGIGIAQQDIKKIFKPFVQIDGSFTRKYEGTGLGLPLVHRLVELHGGKVEADSQAGEFSRFTVTLPQDVVKDRLDRHAGDIKKDAPHATILVVDDNVPNVETIADYLQTKSFDLLLAYDGPQAVKLAREKKPDLILMDVQMPVMNGLEAIKIIRQWEQINNFTTKVPIIALTGLTTASDQQECLEAGADDFISKPVSFKKLIGRIEELIGRD